MDKKYQEIIRLMRQQPLITADSLAQYLHVSSRSIKNYIKDINIAYPGLISSSNRGYSLIEDTYSLSEILDSTKLSQPEIPNSSIERQMYIIIKILNHETAVNIFDLAEEFYVSYSTIQTELKKIRQKLSKFNLKLTSKNNILTIQGSEQDKRALISHLLYKESEIDFMDLSSVKRLFPKLKIENLKTEVEQLFNQHQFFMNDYSLVSFLLHLAITINRLQAHKPAATNMSHPISLSESIQSLSHELVQLIEELYPVHFTVEEEYELALLLVSKSSNVDYKHLDSHNLSDYVGKDIPELTQAIITYLHHTYSISFEHQKDFFLRFSLHLKNLLFRAKNNFLNKNPLVDSIKMQNPLIYEMAVEVASIIQSYQHIQLNDDEIAYIAFHIGILLDTQRHQIQTISAVVYSPDYYENSYRLVTNISNTFKENLSIKSVVNEESDLASLEHYDLLICTVPLNTLVPTPTILVSMFLTPRDVENIRRKIEEIETSIKKQVFKTKLCSLMTPEIFHISNQKSEKDATIHAMCQTLQQHGYVSESFEHDILFRERLSSTGFDQFAIPHSITMNANKTAIAIWLAPKGILWGNHVVKLVMMMCFNPNNRSLFQEIFEPITTIFTNPVALNTIITSHDYSEFIDSITEYYEI